MKKDSQLYFIDLFCGAGGVTTGLHNAMVDGIAIAKVIACVNHDANAIKSHYLNHKKTKHYTEDIRTLDISGIIAQVLNIRRKNPNAIICLWASLECTNFSKAKGGSPRNADSRTLAEHLYRYIEGFNPDYIFIENVEEFMSWGPLDENGKPVSRDAGRDFMRWKKQIMSYGYSHDHQILNSADYGAYTSRKRYFGLFAAPGFPLKFPEPTHSKKPFSDQFGSLLKWKPVKDVLDFSDEGNSIFDRKKNLSPKTMQRILAGLIKYVAGGKENFIAKYYSSKNPAEMCISTDSPAGTITCVDGQSLVQPVFLAKYNSGNDASRCTSINDPSGTITTANRHALIQTKFLSKYHGKGQNIIGMDETCSTLTTKDRLALVQPAWLDKQYGSGDMNHQSVQSPSGTIMPNDKHALVQTKWLDKYYNGDHNHSSLESPAGTVMGVDKHRLVTTKWIMNTAYSNVGTSIEDPAPTITASRRYHYVMKAEPFVFNNNSSTAPSLSINSPAPTITANRTHYIVNPAWGGNPGDVNQPCPTIIARQDKAPLYLVSTAKGLVSIAVYDTDDETTIKIKEFMVLYGIVDIKMRMLKIPELLLIQGFPKGYQLFGNQADQKKFIGNSVTPVVPEKWVEIIYRAITEQKIKAAA